MAEVLYKWDCFIAHAGGDKEAAERLYDLLAPQARTFLDTRCLILGDDWDSALPAAQRASLITVVLVSSKTEDAYYQREEIAAAIALARKDSKDHRVVPVYLDSDAKDSSNTPYGLRGKHGLQLSDELDLDGAAQRLLSTLEQLKQVAAEPGTPAAPMAGASVDSHSNPQPERRLSKRKRQVLVGAALAAAAMLVGAAIPSVRAAILPKPPPAPRAPGVLVLIDKTLEPFTQVRVDLFGKTAEGKVEQLGSWSRPENARWVGKGYAVLFEGEGYDKARLDAEVAANIPIGSPDWRAGDPFAEQPTRLVDPSLWREVSAKLMLADGTERAQASTVVPEYEEGENPTRKALLSLWLK